MITLVLIDWCLVPNFSNISAISWRDHISNISHTAKYFLINSNRQILVSTRQRNSKTKISENFTIVF